MGINVSGIEDAGKTITDLSRGEDREVWVAVNEIRTPETYGGRRVKQTHVLSLMESIADVGLIHPITVNSQHELLAGAHRLQALLLLQDKEPEVFFRFFPDGKVPVREMAISGHDEALRIEIAENEKRRDFTRGEVLQVIERLKKAGYVTKRGGKKLPGDKEHITDALARIMGKSRRTARRIYEMAEKGSAASARTDADAVKLLTRCRTPIEVYLKHINESDDTDALNAPVVIALRQALRLIEEATCKVAPPPQRGRRSQAA